MAYLYLTEQGSILRKAGDRLIIEKEDEVLLDIPYHKLETVLLFGNVHVTTQAMAELLEKGVSLSMFSRHGHYRGSLEPPRGKNIDLRIAQFEAFRDHDRALGLARAIVAAKIGNGGSVLDLYQRHHEAGPDFAGRRQALDDAVAACASVTDIARLDGVEGSAAREYFGLAMQFNKSELAWPGRVKHPATDPLNALLSLTYTLLMNELAALLEGSGLDPYLGFLHHVDYGRPSLALDLMEPFRHPVADRLVLVNRRVLEAGDFQPGGEAEGIPPEFGAVGNRVAKSVGLNFGTKYLTGYRTWPRGQTIPHSLHAAALDLFAFDALIQNPDRGADRPNLLTGNDRILAIDHDSAFSFIHALGGPGVPSDLHLAAISGKARLL